MLAALSTSRRSPLPSPRAIPWVARFDYSGGMLDENERLFADAAAGSGESLEKLLERYLPQLHAYVRARLGAGLGPREASVT